MRAQNELSHISGRNVRPFNFQSVEDYADLSRLGICFDGRDMEMMFDAIVDSHGMDTALVNPLTQATITTPIQFLQAWLPGFVNVITAARRIDELVGITTQGRWEDEEIVQGVMEYTGEVSPYGDYTNVPLSSWNVNYERRTIVRFEEGIMVGVLEEKRAAAIRTDSAAAKRSAAGLALEINRNQIGFFGYNNGDNRTYGFLNDPQLPAYVPVAGTDWPTKTFLEITADLRTAMATLRTQSRDKIDPSRDQMTLAVATNSVDFLTTVSDQGITVLNWLDSNYKNTRVISAPELDEANGGDNVFYLYADEVPGDGSTDDSRTFVQIVPAKFQTLGVEQRAKAYVEDYSNATAGIMTKRPYAVVRFSGI